MNNVTTFIEFVNIMWKAVAVRPAMMDKETIDGILNRLTDTLARELIVNAPTLNNAAYLKAVEDSNQKAGAMVKRIAAGEISTDEFLVLLLAEMEPGSEFYELATGLGVQASYIKAVSDLMAEILPILMAQPTADAAVDMFFHVCSVLGNHLYDVAQEGHLDALIENEAA